MYVIEYDSKYYHLINDDKINIQEIAKGNTNSHLIINTQCEVSKNNCMYFDMKVSNIIDNNIFKYINNRIKTNNVVLKNSSKDDPYIKQSNILLNFIKNKKIYEKLFDIYLLSDNYAKDFSLLIEPIYQQLNENTCNDLYKNISWEISKDYNHSYIRQRMLKSILIDKLLLWTKEKFKEAFENPWISCKIFNIQNLLYQLYVLLNIFELKENIIIIYMNKIHINKFLDFFNILNTSPKLIY